MTDLSATTRVRHTAADVAAQLTAARRMTQVIDAALAEEGLRVDAWRVLQCVEAEHGLPMITIAERLSVSPATITRIVDDLDENGYLFRRVAPEDGRKLNVYLSRSGNEKLARLNAIVEAITASI